VSLTVFEALGFEGNPFAPSAAKKELFRSASLDHIVDELAYALQERKGIALLTGESGCGKTTIVQRVLARLDHKTSLVCSISNTMLDKHGLLMAVAKGFFLTIDENASSHEIFDSLQLYLIDQSTRGINNIVILDEAHHISPEGLEALRLLGDAETVDGKLLQILLVGCPELLDTLDLPELERLQKRVAVSEHISPFTKSDTARYIRQKLSGASTNLSIGKEEAALVHTASGGNPSFINRIMERALYAVVAYGKANLNGECVREALEEVAKTQPQVAGRMRRKRTRRRTGHVAFAAVLVMLVLTPFAPGKENRRSFFDIIAQRYFIEHIPRGELRGEGALSDASGLGEDEALFGRQSFIPGKSLLGKDFAESARTFLDPHGFDDAYELMAEAVIVGDERILKRRIPPGWRLLRLDRLPVGVNLNFTAFPWRHFRGDGPYWLVLWKPKYSFDELYPGLSGDAVAALQLRLGRLGLFSQEVDGVLGPETLAALSTFQGDMDLPRTMSPDPVTLFWLFSLG
jgi:type II secretory pathway predicted ATPase ExeA